MADKLETSYRTAEGLLLNAMQALRRFDSKEALGDIKAAIRIVESAKVHADRERHLSMYRVQAAPPVPFDPASF